MDNGRRGSSFAEVDTTVADLGLVGRETFGWFFAVFSGMVLFACPSCFLCCFAVLENYGLNSFLRFQTISKDMAQKSLESEPPSSH